MEPQYDILLRAIICGQSGTGKTCLLSRIVSPEKSIPEEHIPTIGVDFGITTLNVSGVNCKFQVWDTAGSQRFITITRSYYRGANIAVLVYAVNNRQSFLGLNSFLSQITEHSNGSMIIIIVGNKSDSQNRQVTEQQGQAFAEQKGCIFMEVSAKTSTNLRQILSKAAEVRIQRGDVMHPRRNQVLIRNLEEQRLNPAVVEEKLQVSHLAPLGLLVLALMMMLLQII